MRYSFHRQEAPIDHSVHHLKAFSLDTKIQLPMSLTAEMQGLGKLTLDFMHASAQT
jgi:hypothetical protein